MSSFSYIKTGRTNENVAKRFRDAPAVVVVVELLEFIDICKLNVNSTHKIKEKVKRLMKDITAVVM